MKIYKIDGRWLPDSVIECYNETGDKAEQCKGCAMQDFTKRIVVFNKIEGKEVELVDRESCPYFIKLMEINILNRQLENTKNRILKARQIMKNL
jgi:hypothetical protein